MEQQSPLGLIAGEGQFPFLIAKGARRFDKKVVAIGFKGHTSAEIMAHVDDFKWLSLGQLGKMISWLKKKGVSEAVLAGGIHKPKAIKIRPDLRAAKLLWRSKSKNDNAVLGLVAEEISQEGIQIVSPLKYAPELKMPAGQISKRKPSKKEWQDILFGWPLAKQLGGMDIGQCLVVKEQMVVAVEAMEGTNETILRAGKLAGPGCVVLKVFKPGQEKNIDQPSIGLKTVKCLIESKASCLIAEAGRSLFFDQAESIEAANSSGICIYGYQGND